MHCVFNFVFLDSFYFTGTDNVTVLVSGSFDLFDVTYKISPWDGIEPMFKQYKQR